MENNNILKKVKDYATKTAIAVTAYIILKDTLKYVFRAIKEYDEKRTLEDIFEEEQSWKSGL